MRTRIGGMIMFFVKLPFRLAAIPVMLGLSVIQFFTSLFIGLSSIVTNLIGFASIVTACCTWMFHIGPAADGYYMLTVGLIFILLPHIAQSLVNALSSITARMIAFIIP